jgi:flagellar assembly protein FliH
MATVLKADDAGLRGGRAHPLNLDDLEALAQDITRGARERAKQILIQAQQEAEALRRGAAEAGHKEGFEQGFTEGTAKGHEQALNEAVEQFATDQDQLVEALQSVLTEFEGQRNQLLAAARDELIRLAVAIARRVTKRYAQSDTEVAVENLKEIIERVGQRHVARIAVNPADAEAMRRFASSLAQAESRWDNVTIAEEADVEPGGCRIRLPDGEIDAGIETQLDRIAAALLPGDQTE